MESLDATVQVSKYYMKDDNFSSVRALRVISFGY